MTNFKDFMHHEKMVAAFRDAFHSTWPDLVDLTESALQWYANDLTYIQELEVKTAKASDISLFEAGALDLRAYRGKNISFKLPLLDGSCARLKR